MEANSSKASNDDITAPQPTRPRLLSIKTAPAVKTDGSTSPIDNASSPTRLFSPIAISPTDSEAISNEEPTSPNLMLPPNEWDPTSAMKRSASYNSFLSSRIPPFASFEPPFYGRPARVPTSPSFATLLPPAFFNPSRTSTPDQQPAVAPRTPTHEFSGFVLYLGSFLVYSLYLVWAYFPDELLESMGISYYPSRIWALVLPSWTFVLIIFIYAVFTGMNLYRTPSFDSFHCITDEHANIIDIKTLQQKYTQRKRSHSALQRRKPLALSVSGSATPSPSPTPRSSANVEKHIDAMEHALKTHVARKLNGSAPAALANEVDDDGYYVPDLHDIPIKVVNQILFENNPSVRRNSRKRTISGKGPRVMEITEHLRKSGMDTDGHSLDSRSLPATPKTPKTPPNRL